MQTGSEPDFVLFFDCPEEEMVKRVLSRNQVLLKSLMMYFSD
jgi:UMP-CMP kinase